MSFPRSSKYRISSVIPRFIGIRNIKFHSPVGRITEVYSNSVFSSVIPRLSDDEMSKKSHPQCVWSRDVTNQMSISTNHQFTNTFQISQYNYQHDSEQSFSPMKLQFPGVGSPSSTNMGIPLFLLIQNKSSWSSYIHNYITSIHNILSQK